MSALRSPLRTTLAVALTVLAACTPSTTTSPGGKDPASLTKAEATRSCPFGVAGAEVLVTDTDAGVTMTFKTTPDKLADLRERVADAAAVHGPGEELGKGHDGKHGDGGKHGLRAYQLPPMKATFEKIDGGARLTLDANAKDDAVKLRAKARERAKEMTTSCDD